MLGSRMLLALALLAGSQSALAEDRLTPLLRFVPADAVAEGAVDALTFADLAAIRQAVPMRLSLVDGFSWSAEDRAVAALMRTYALAGMLHEYARNFTEIGRMADYVGFAWSDIETVVGFGRPPTNPIIVTGGAAAADADAIGTVLSGRGFAAEARGGHTIWWRLDDDRNDLANRDTADPLRGVIGGSARAGVVDGAFIAAANWGGIELMLDAIDGTAPSLAASPDFVALAHAVAQPVGAEGLILQAYLIDGALEVELVTVALGGAATPEAAARIEQELADMVDAAGTPRYGAIAYADRQEGGTPVGVIALAYADRADAETAARTVPAAFASQWSLRWKAPFAEIMPYDVVADVVEGPGGARYVARVAFSQSAAGSLEGPAANRNLAFEALVQMLFVGDVSPLLATE